MDIYSQSVDETAVFAQQFIDELAESTGERTGAVVVGLIGELGAGKTAFVKALAETLGVEEVVTSPTFVIEKIYALYSQPFHYLIHIDAYRLEDASELLPLGFSGLITDPGNLVVVEWADRVEGVLPENVICIEFTVVEENERQITVRHRQ